MKKSGLFALMICMLGTVYGQVKQPVLRISPFTDNGAGSSEASMLERLINSYIVELKLFRVIDAKGQEIALMETEAALSLGASATAALPLTADFIISGMLGKIDNLYIFTLENTKVSSGEKLSVSDTANTISDIVLRARSLTRSLFGKQDPPQTASSTMPTSAGATPASSFPVLAGVQPAEDAVVFKSPGVKNLVGTWKGDKGLENVRLLPNGTGIAVLSGGGTMKVRISIDADAIMIVQDQPNNVAMYKSVSVTLDMAKKIAAQARPMQWIFTLSPDGLNLSGTKESVSISGNGTTLKVDNSYQREATWTRISR
ncbi:MAG: hypothetical protein A2Z96_01955 [Spirochaetes bacterium GWB1_48_6]|nr:MAG: hypothetical protein A2Z96_01955 [Spirochaetes bacterium GWB1_48_6]